MSADHDTNFQDVRFVFLDRDGVLNRKPDDGKYVTSVKELAPLPGVGEAVAQLNRSGRKAIVVTNQRGIALGLYTQEDLARIHDELRRVLAEKSARLDAIYVCPHNSGQCNCRKPLTGLFEQAFHDFPEATPTNSVMIGDSIRDVEAGVRFGMRTVFIRDDAAGVTNVQTRAAELANATVPSLAAFVSQYMP
jgi:D-glycero-D-manno-heptose 1,7-bisphosphate phosphatase